MRAAGYGTEKEIERGRAAGVRCAIGQVKFAQLTGKKVDAIINQPDRRSCCCTWQHLATFARIAAGKKYLQPAARTWQHPFFGSKLPTVFAASLPSICLDLAHSLPIFCSMTRFFSLIPAAGSGTRMAAGRPKQYLQLAGKPVLRHVLDTFAAATEIDHTWVVVAAADGDIDAVLAAAPSLAAHVTVVRSGGASRHETVANGLLAMRAAVADDDWVLVHDAARPGLSVAQVTALVAALRDDPVGGLLALPVVDTVRRASADGRSSGTVARDGLWLAQTPQKFRYGLLCRALARAPGCTDEASAVEALGLQPRLIPGSARNFKLTLPADIALASLYLKQETNDE